jgi:DNA modification methylase
MATEANQIELSLSLPSDADASAPVECLGLTFANDTERRTYFLDKLREKLLDPEFRQIEGFPIGADEDILALSDPPYYTACPNPFLADFIRCYGKPYDPETDDYHREPFAADVSEGKSDPLYKAHSYHTKVPHKAIMRYILHYTEPGNVVLDGFAGSGMTGVAAQMCAYPDPDLKYAIESERNNAGLPLPEWGSRKTILNDLGVAATFIEANYNLPFDVKAFEREAKKILSELEEECGWMYETIHDGETKGKINYTVWSQIFGCPQCEDEIIFSEAALDPDTKRVKESFSCPHCDVDLSKGKLNRLYDSVFDPIVNKIIQTLKRKPVLINYTINKTKYEKKPDDYDLQVLQRVSLLSLPINVPNDEIPFMHMTHQRARMEAFGITHTHHFFLPRTAQILGKLWSKAKAIPDSRSRNMLLFFVEQSVWGMSVLARYTPTHFSQVNQYLNGVYYVASQHAECSPWYILDGKLKRLIGAFKKSPIIYNQAIVSTGTAAKLSCPDNSVDYIFTDPPFGENIYYADLNFLVESWHKVKTDATIEAIIDKAKEKDILAYQHLMQQCFTEYYRVLKPNRWMTVIFHNSHNTVWNSIQKAILKAKFIVANVQILDKRQGSYRQVTSTAVKQDLVITVYKPNEDIERYSKLTEETEDSVWDFVRSHLQHLPVFVGKPGQVEILLERMNYRLFDRMIAFYVSRGVTVLLSKIEFYKGLERFKKRDEMYFLKEQLAEYDLKRMSVKDILQLELLVTNESTAILWLRQQLTKRPQTYQELHPNFTKGLTWMKYEKEVELRQILDSNFLRYKGDYVIPKQIVAWLRQSAKYRERIQQISPQTENGLAMETTDSLLVEAARDRYYIPDPSEQSDIEKLREIELLKEFEGYHQTKQKKLTVFRLEAIETGFRKAWKEHEWQTIVDFVSRVDATIIQENEVLQMFYDNAITKLTVDSDYV